MRLSCLFLVLFTFFLGCAGPINYQYHKVSKEENHTHWKVYPVYLDRSLTEKERLEVWKVTNEWNYALNGYMAWHIESQYFDHTNQYNLANMIDQVKTSHEGLLVFGLKHDEDMTDKLIDDEEILALVNSLGDNAHALFLIQDRIGNKDLHRILLHEFGHAMGAQHVSAESLMFNAYGPMQLGCIDKITAAQVANYHKLDLSKMNYCATPNFE